MSQSQSGRAAAQARRQAQLGGASTSQASSSSQPSQRRAAKAAPAQAPIPTRAEQGAGKAAPAAPAPATASSRPRQQVISQPIAVSEGREAAKKRRNSLMKGNRGVAQAPQKSSENPHPKAKAYQKRVNEQVVKAEEQTQAVINANGDNSQVSQDFLAVSASKKDNTVTGKPIVVAEGRTAAQKRRQAQLRGNSGYQKQTSENPHPKAKAMQARAEAKAESQVEAAPAKVEIAPKALTTTRGTNRNEVKTTSNATSANPGRGMSRAYRKARTLGKSGETAYKTKGSQAGAVARINNPDASSREIAQKVRAERCTRGKTCGTAQSSNANRSRKNDNAAPEKVGYSTTLQGQGVSGTLVGQGSTTGAEYGACQTVSGTEYLSSEEFNTHCGSTPEAGKAKVTRTQTTKGETISGTAVGNAKPVTGDRAGACTALTGTEYLPADQAEKFCGTQSAAPKQVTGFSINASQMGAQEGGSNVTGGEGYKSQSTSIRPSEPSAPRKVMPSQTASGNETTGTQVGRVADVTGDEKGYCKSVTGTGYQGTEETETFCDSEPTPAPPKVTASGTASGQKVTGDRSGETTGMTGAEAGTCKAVTGSSYMSADHGASCGTEAKAEIQHRTMGSVMPGKHALTGAQPGPEGLTGAEKGACELVSGTPYQGAGQTAAVCGGQASASQPGESDFPQLMNNHVPAAPVSAPQMMQAPVVGMPTAAPVEETSQENARITGDGWDRGAKITGTEGESVTSRNASYGTGKGSVPEAGAHGFRPNAMPEVPHSTITGSSGNTDTGAKVTLTGGARA